ncbi:hypothetical protein AZF37_07645 [endosymbiont 'TC1' of Trimyema compressum]|uniref:thioether cross-link-forming SCIFF peptide maturase n=1 Tax=endosymbiont 'TC1' of Trimyema compressum TaxID=243899 RepID=UPI0007F08EA1|nr:thioether cross-link-forming SCIFF peptide maturase [endosymbiont 'TC1' of Trimyema compressum]AMP21052.1 hypothetical protein AZF37_07645 [endosymbiont 'TC1' of Trimyema compressum]
MINKDIKIIEFEKNKQYIILDVNSGSIHLFDAVAKNALEKYIGGKASSIIEDDEKEALSTILELEKKGLLFTTDTKKLPKKVNQSLKSICLNVAHTCNLACPYCFAAGGNYKGNEGLMSADIGKKAIDYLLENSSNRPIVEVDFFGGEPLLNFSLIKYLMPYGNKKAKELGKTIKWSMTTNGVLLNNQIQDFLIENNVGTVLSIDGRKEVHNRHRYFKNKKGSYDIVLKNYLSFKNKTEDYVVRGTYTGYNKDFYNDVKTLKELGFKHISMEPVITDGETPWDLKESDLSLLEDSYERLKTLFLEWYNKENPVDFFHFNIDLKGGPCLYKRITACGAGFEYIAITPEGDIFPCHQLIKDNKYKMGSLVDNTFNQNIKDTFQKSTIYSKESCSSCWARFYCSGGCHANNFHFSNNLQIPYQLGCDLEKIRLEKALWAQVYMLLNPKEKIKGNDKITQEKIKEYVKEQTHA